MSDNADLHGEEQPVPLAVVEETLDGDLPEMRRDKAVGPWPYMAHPGTRLAEGDPTALPDRQGSVATPDIT